MQNIGRWKVGRRGIGRMLLGSIVLVGLVAGCAGGDDAADAATPSGTPTPTATAETSPVASQEDRMAKSGDTVSVHYRGTLDSGEEFDSSRGGQPLQFTLGANEVIAGFDEAITGMSVGETKTVRIPAENAYGEHRDDLVIVVPAAQAPDGLEVGQQVFLGDAPATVTSIGPDGVTVDANHPLAGEALTFEVELVGID
jgi:FKBP-type peptidyl-prolyl cis-trans isomerase 2